MMEIAVKYSYFFKQNHIFFSNQYYQKKLIYNIFNSLFIYNTLMNSTEIKKIKSDSKSYAKNTSSAHLVEVLKRFSDYYYNKDEPLISDSIFDTLLSELKKKSPNNKFFETVGAPTKGKKVKLPFYTGSLDKKKPDSKELDRWLDDYSGQCVVSDKLDGDSAVLQQKDGKLKLYTRGDGFVGKDISHLINLIFDEDFLDDLIDDDFTVRGELIVTIDDFEKLSKKITTSAGNEISNARALIGVLVNSKTIDERVKKVASYTHYVTYKVFDPVMKPSEQLKWLKKNDFEVVRYEVMDDLNEKYLKKKLLERKEKSDFEIDGLVIIHNKIYKLVPDKHPKESFAYKLPSETAEVKVLDVLWEASQYGYLKPEIVIEKTFLSGVYITYITAHNAKYIIDNKIGIGAIVKIIRAGEVIPKILEVIKPAKEIKYPKIEYKWNDTKVDFVLINKKENKLVLIKKITAFFKTIGVDNMGQGIITKLVNNGFDSIKKIIEAKINKIADIEGLGDKSAKKIKQSIKDSLENLTLAKLMAATLIFGRGFGEKKLIVILREQPKIVEEKHTYNELVDIVSNIEGFSTKTAEQFAKHLPVFIKFLDHMKDILDIKKILKNTPKKKKAGELSGKKIVLTGFRDKQLQSNIEDIGGKVSTAISNNTNIVIAKDIDDSSSKLLQAKKKNIPIMTVKEFKKKYKIE